MNVLMLGWEYPPHIAGGLGVACEGITRALARRGARIHFLVPSLAGDEAAPHMTLHEARSAQTHESASAGSLETLRLPAQLLPYGPATPTPPSTIFARAGSGAGGGAGGGGSPTGRPTHYGRDLFAEVARYAGAVADTADGLDFDLIHAHDWMTAPAALEVKRRTGRPMVLHVHSTEADRAGMNGNETIVAIERGAIAQADAVIAVSQYTRSVVCAYAGIDPGRVSVAYNGIHQGGACRSAQPDPKRPVVLFLGRVTFQKGPDYFLRAAAMVLKAVPDAQFVVAGAGDMLGQSVRLAHELGIERNVLFTGFLRGADVDRAYASATLYVMPSVSEPFGLTALEAVRSGVPCILSRQSGVSEVVRHALRVDFWDTHRLADLIINALASPELRRQLVEMSARELAALKWDAGAERIEQVYRSLLREPASRED